MSQAILSSTIKLSISLLSEEELTSIKKALTYKLPGKGAIPDEIIWDYSIINNAYTISIPFARQDLVPKRLELEDRRVSVYLENFPKFSDKFTLRSSQQKIVETDSDNFIINANPSFGKTFTCLALAARLKQKTLVIVHSSALLDQWSAEIKKVLGSDFSTITKGVVDVQGSITVATIQTLVKHVLSLKNTFGLVIVDETHKAPAATYQKILGTLKPYYRIGATATLNRKDQKEFLIYNSISQKVVSPDQKENVLPIKVLRVDTGLPFMYSGNWARALTALYDNDTFKTIVSYYTIKLYREGHSVILMTNRIQAINDFYELIKPKIPELQVISGKTNSASKDRESIINTVERGNCRAIIVSTSIFSEGISINALSGMVLAQPTNNSLLLEQIMNRISRPPKAGKDKKDPVFVDFNFTGNLGKKHRLEKDDIYPKLGATVANEKFRSH